MTNKNKEKKIYVYAHWTEKPELMGILYARPSRAKEVFAFEYDHDWLKQKRNFQLDPNLSFYQGQQHLDNDVANFGIFLDSSPDRWGRVLMRRREILLAKEGQRAVKTLLESDYLLGVYDENRSGALRFKLNPEEDFLDSNKAVSSPPWTQLRDLEYASLKLEKNESVSDDRWLKLLIAPGSSLGGARPKANVMDEDGNLWIAKFPSANDDLDIGAWEFLAHQLATKAKINTTKAQLKKFNSKQHTFLTKRFDRIKKQRIHFASAMTMLSKQDGNNDSSYLDMVNFLIRNGSQVNKDLEELWRRIVFNICISNTDDHLRNHGFILEENGWTLSPAYDMNPSETGNGLNLNISTTDNSQSLDLALEVKDHFRLSSTQANKIIKEVTKAVSDWKKLAEKSFSKREISRMENAFRCPL
jgi:serine/threonine-protein kinase HipA